MVVGSPVGFWTGGYQSVGHIIGVKDGLVVVRQYPTGNIYIRPFVFGEVWEYER